MVDTNSYQNLDADTPFLDPNQKKNVHTRRNIIVAVLIVAVVVAVAAVLLMKDDDSKEPWEKENPYGPVWTGDRDARFGTPDSLNKEQSSVMKRYANLLWFHLHLDLFYSLYSLFRFHSCTCILDPLCSKSFYSLC